MTKPEHDFPARIMVDPNDMSQDYDMDAELAWLLFEDGILRQIAVNGSLAFYDPDKRAKRYVNDQT